MRTPRRTLAKGLAALLGLAVILTPATMAGAATKAPAKKACVLKKKAKCKKARIVKAKVGKVNIAGADLAGATITGATFKGTNLSGVNLTGATISNTTFTGAKVANLKLDKAKLTNVTFNGVTLGTARQASREHDCTVTEGMVADTASDIFTCTGGGVSMRGARLSRNVAFRNSVIPSSDFADISTGEGAKKDLIAGYALLVLYGTDARGSNFARSQALVGVYADNLTGARSNVSRSIFNNASIWAMFKSDAMESSFIGAQWVFSGPSEFEERDVVVTGSRGLEGVRTVTVTTQAGVTAVGATNIREDGFWRMGVVCGGSGVANCVNPGVAVGQPVVVKAWATTPIQIAGPSDWACERVAGTSTYPYLAQCTVPASARVDQTAQVQAYTPPPMRTVSVTMRDGMTMLPDPQLTATISQLNADRSVAATNSCTGTASCSLVVPQGSTVTMSFAAPQQLVGWCSDTAPIFTGTSPPASTYTCPDAVAMADIHATVQTS